MSFEELKALDKESCEIQRKVYTNAMAIITDLIKEREEIIVYGGYYDENGKFHDPDGVNVVFCGHNYDYTDDVYSLLNKNGIIYVVGAEIDCEMELEMLSANEMFAVCELVISYAGHQDRLGISDYEPESEG